MEWNTCAHSTSAGTAKPAKSQNGNRNSTSAKCSCSTEYCGAEVTPSGRA